MNELWVVFLCVAISGRKDAKWKYVFWGTKEVEKEREMKQRSCCIVVSLTCLPLPFEGIGWYRRDCQQTTIPWRLQSHLPQMLKASAALVWIETMNALPQLIETAWILTSRDPYFSLSLHPVLLTPVCLRSCIKYLGLEN